MIRLIHTEELNDQLLVSIYISLNCRKERHLKATPMQGQFNKLGSSFSQTFRRDDVFSKDIPCPSREPLPVSRLSDIGSRSLNNSSPVSINIDDEYDPRFGACYQIYRSPHVKGESKGTTLISIRFLMPRERIMKFVQLKYDKYFIYMFVHKYRRNV